MVLQLGHLGPQQVRLPARASQHIAGWPSCNRTARLSLPNRLPAAACHRTTPGRQLPVAADSPLAEADHLPQPQIAVCHLVLHAAQRGDRQAGRQREAWDTTRQQAASQPRRVTVAIDGGRRASEHTGSAGSQDIMQQRHTSHRQHPPYVVALVVEGEGGEGGGAAVALARAAGKKAGAGAAGALAGLGAGPRGHRELAAAGAGRRGGGGVSLRAGCDC